MKQTKTIRVIFAFLLFIPIFLAVIGITQSIILQSRKNALINANTTLTEKEQEEREKQGVLDYLTSDEYKKDYYSHEGYNGEDYGEDGDVEVKLK